MSVHVDLTGHRYGRWQILSRAAESRYNRQGKPVIYWHCRCICGNEARIRGNSLRSGNSKSCGCWNRELLPAKANHARGVRQQKFPPGAAAKKRALEAYKNNAARRGRLWQVSDDDVYALMALPCHYCGTEPCNTYRSKNGAFRYNGVDRRDNSLGYVLSNLVPCCISCNRRKNTMSYDRFRQSFASRREISAAQMSPRAAHVHE